MAEHVQTDSSEYWQEMRRRMTPDEFDRTLRFIDETSPKHFLPSAVAPILVQCARFDTPRNIAGCPLVYAATGSKERTLVWYDDDHHFTSWEAAYARLDWLAKHLRLRNPRSNLLKFRNS